jgi:hypothetical protein
MTCINNTPLQINNYVSLWNTVSTSQKNASNNIKGTGGITEYNTNLYNKLLSKYNTVNPIKKNVLNNYIWSINNTTYTCSDTCTINNTAQIIKPPTTYSSPNTSTWNSSNNTCTCGPGYYPVMDPVYKIIECAPTTSNLNMITDISTINNTITNPGLINLYLK